MTTSPSLGSLFAGVGGFDLGFERAGFSPAWQVEIDPAASSVLARHWPDVPRYADVCAVTGATLAPVDVIAGGFPCQDLSVAGQRRGLSGERSGLFFEITRIVAEMRGMTDGRFPAFVVLENVPGLLSSHRGRDFAVVLRALRECGAMDIAWRVLDSQWFGLAQRRKRVFVVADFGGERAGEILALAEGLRGDSPPRRTAGEAVAGTLGGGAQARGWADDLDRSGAFIPAVSKQAAAHGGPHGRIDAESETFVAHTLRAEGFDASEDGTGRGTPLVAIPINTQIATRHEALGRGTGLGNAEPGDPAYTLQSAHHHAVAFDTYKQAVDELAYALRNGHNDSGSHLQAVTAGMTVRRLMPVETERLQGFPDGWTRYRAGGREQADGPRYRQMGNAVSVPVAGWIARRMLAVIEEAAA